MDALTLMREYRQSGQGNGFCGSNQHTSYDDSETLRFAERLEAHLTCLVYVLDIDQMRPIYTNAVAASFVGLSPEDPALTRDTFLLDIVHPDDRPFALSHMADFECLNDGDVIEFEQRILHGSGEWRWVAMRETVFNRRPDGRPYQVLGTANDVTDQKRSIETLRENAALLNRAFEAAPIGKAIIGLDGRWLRVNRALCTIVGYEPHELANLDFQAITHPDDLAKDLSYVAQLLHGEIQQYEMEKRYIRKDGSTVWILLSVSLIRDQDGKPHQFVSQIQDISRRKRAEEQIAAQALKLEEAQRVAGIGSWDVDVETGVLDWSSEMFRLLNFDTGDGVPDHKAVRSRYHPDDAPLVDAVLGKALVDGEPFDMDVRIVGNESAVTWLHLVGRGELRDGKVNRIFGTALDITERKAAQQIIHDYSVVLEAKMAELEALAMRDGLTGLLNHRAFHDRLHETFALARRHNTPVSVIMLDVDHFKQYNDTFGHPEGDAVLRQVAEILHSTNRTTDSCARYGGEEFAVILPNTNGQDALLAAERIRVAIESHPWALRPVTVSVGVASLGVTDESDRVMLVRADAALYTSKQLGRNRVSSA